MMQVQPNVLLIVIDSLRADFTDPTLMPQLNEFKNSAISFTNAFSQGISSAPSMASLLTSTWPLDYGGHWYLHTSRKTIAEVLTENGYSTAAIHSNPNLSRLRNFDKGFDEFDESLLPPIASRLTRILPESLLPFANKFFRIIQARPYLPADKLNQKAISWISQAQKPWFVWMQYMDVHGPYMSHRKFLYADKLRAELLWRKAAVTDPESVTDTERTELLTNYQAEIRYTDEQLGMIVRNLASLGQLKDTLVIITADHGDEFGEHGRYGHINKPYDELIHVPLVIKPPQIWQHTAQRREYDEPVRLLDLMPTIIDCCDICLNEGTATQLEGTSLIPMIQGQYYVPLAPCIIEKEVKRSDKLRIGIREQEWKYLVDGVDNSRELYHLQSDPQEQENVIDIFPEEAHRFEQQVAEHLHFVKNRSANINLPAIMEHKEVEDRLRSLGYL